MPAILSIRKKLLFFEKSVAPFAPWVKEEKPLTNAEFGMRNEGPIQFIGWRRKLNKRKKILDIWHPPERYCWIGLAATSGRGIMNNVVLIPHSEFHIPH
jgi:hypothetical protein